MSEELHPLDQLCTSCRLRIYDSASGRSYTHPTLLNSLEEVSGVVLGMYAPSRKATLMTIELSDDPAMLPTQIHLRFDDDMFNFGEDDAQHDPVRARKNLEIALRAIATTLRRVYEGVFGSDRVRKGGRPVLAWEDLL